MAHEDLERVLGWRNHPLVRRHMYTRHPIEAHEHRAWFERVCADPQRHALVFERDGLALGFVNFSVSAQGNVAQWGFYAAPQAPRGTGSALGRTALRHGFEALGFHRIGGQALAHNSASIRLHRMLGFQQEGILREQHFELGRYVDVVCFGLLAAEWRAHLSRAVPP